MATPQKFARPIHRADNVPAPRPADVDPRLDPFLRELAQLLWRDVKLQLELGSPKKKQEER